MLSNVLRTVAFAVLIGCAGCSSQEPRPSEPGVYEVGRLRVTLPSGWYEQRGSDLPDTPARSRTWSREGLEHDRLFVIGGADDGQSMFKASDYTGMPVFRSKMSAADDENHTMVR